MDRGSTIFKHWLILAPQLLDDDEELGPHEVGIVSSHTWKGKVKDYTNLDEENEEFLPKEIDVQ
jgi:hypothetical protein